MAARLDVPLLEGSLVRLEPLTMAHADDLAVAAAEDRSSYAFTSVPTAATVREYIGAHLQRAERGEMVPFAQVRRSDGRAVGCTSYFDFRHWPERDDLASVMIGWTWLGSC